MFWNESESGCEIDFETLGHQEAAAAAKAGFPELDTLLAITPRGWDSLKAASVFAGFVAQASGGCVTESDGEYIASEDALGWITNAIRAADDGAELEGRRSPVDPAEHVQEYGAENMAVALRGLTGNVAKLILINHRLFIHLEDGSSFQGNTWRLRLADKVLDVSRWRKMMQIHTEVLLGDGPDKECMKRADAMQEDLAKAKELDDKDMIDAYAFLKAVDSLSVESARLVSQTSIEVTLSGETGSRLEFSADVYLADFRVSVASITAQIRAPSPVP